MQSKLTQSIVRELLDYDPETGLFIWRQRDRKWFSSETSWKIWNTKFAGKRALTANNRNYLVGTILDVQVSAHRVAFLWMTGRWPYPQIDHKNRIGTDNRWCNLREATGAQNMINRGPFANNTTGATGVWPRRHGAHDVFIGRKYLGRFTTVEAAMAARQKAEQDLWAGREVTPFYSMQRQRLRSNNKSGTVGVSRKKNGTYQAMYLGEYLGTFKTLQGAAAMRQYTEQEFTAGVFRPTEAQLRLLALHMKVAQ